MLHRGQTVGASCRCVTPCQREASSTPADTLPAMSFSFVGVMCARCTCLRQSPETEVYHLSFSLLYQQSSSRHLNRDLPVPDLSEAIAGQMVQPSVSTRVGACQRRSEPKTQPAHCGCPIASWTDDRGAIVPEDTSTSLKVRSEWQEGRSRASERDGNSCLRRGYADPGSSTQQHGAEGDA